MFEPPSEIYRTQLHLLEDNNSSLTNVVKSDKYRLTNSAKGLDIKLNYQGLPLDKSLYSFIGSELEVIRWAQIQISAGKNNGTWLL